MNSKLLLNTTFSLLVASLPLHAQDLIIENDYFIVTLQDADSWQNIGPALAGIDEVSAEVNNVLNYWGSLFADGHRPASDAGKVTVSLSFVNMLNDKGEKEENIIGNSSPELLIYNTLDKNDPDYYYPFMLSTGAGVNTLSTAEAKLLAGFTGANAGNAAVADITINFNSNFAFYFGETAGLTELTLGGVNAMDFNTVLLHEMAHGIGFMSTQFSGIDGSPQGPTINSMPIYVDGKLVTYVTPWDALMELDAEAYKPGDQITLAGVTDSEVFNPIIWQSGSSMSHLTKESDPTAVMKPSIDYGEYYREFSAMELQVYEAMGWNFGYIIPEPSTATLSLVALAGLLARRRRRVAK